MAKPPPSRPNDDPIASLRRLLADVGPWNVAQRRRAFIGSMRGEFEIPDDFDAPDPEIERLFGMRDDD